MPDLSIIELAFFGFVELFSLAMLIISTVKEIPNERASSIIRAIYLIPGMIAAAFIAANSGEKIIFDTINTTTLTHAANGTILTNATTIQNTVIALQNPVWGYLHILIFFVLFIFVINQMYNLLTKPE